jgi:hypothetical protein
MDKLKLRYLIREAIENVVGVSAKFSIGDKVTTVDGDTATVTMAEHPFYTVELEETGTTKSFNFKDLAPFQEKEISKTSEGIMLQEGAIASPGLMFHQQHKKPLSECIFRIGSEAYVDFYAEARELFNEGVLKVNELDRDLIRNTDIGEYGIFEGKKIALDIPFINEREDALGIYDDGRGNSAAIGWTPDGYLATVDGEYDFQIGPAKTVEELIKMLADEGFTNKIFEAQFKGKDVPLNKPKRGGSKAYYVYVKDGDKVKKVSFGSGGLRAKINNPEARRAFAARHNCDKKKDRTSAGYWSCNLPRYAKALGLGANKNTFW